VLLLVCESALSRGMVVFEESNLLAAIDQRDVDQRECVHGLSHGGGQRTGRDNKKPLKKLKKKKKKKKKEKKRCLIYILTA